MSNRINIIIDGKDNATPVVKGFTKTLDNASGRAGAFRESLGRIRDVALGVYLPQIAAKIANVGAEAIKSAGEYEQSRVAFETMLGSADKARKLMQQIADFAKTTPFELPEVVQGTKQLLAFGVAQKDLLPVMRKLGDIAAGVGVPVQQLSYVYGQVRLSGKLMAQDLMQFTNAGVPLLDYLSKTMHKTTQQIKSDMDKGAGPSFQDVQKAIDAMTASGSKFGGMMDKQSHTFNGVVSNIKDGFGQILRSAVGMTQAGDIIKGSLFDRIKDAAIAAMPAITNFGASVGPAIDQALKKLDAIAASVGRYLGPKLAELAKTVDANVVPALGKLWHNVLEPMIPVVGKVLVVALGLAIDSLTGLINGTTGLIREIEHGNPVILGLIATFGTLASVMAFNAVFDAITGGFARFTLITIPSMVASLDTIAASSAGVAASQIASFAKASGQMVVSAAVSSAAWVKNAAIASGAWLLELPKLIAQGSLVAAKAVISAADTGLAWVLNAIRVSLVWTVTEMPKLVASFIVTAGAAIVHAATTSWAWTTSAVATSTSWVITELPKIVAGFLLTSGQAIVHAAISSGAWVASAARTAFAWVVTTLPQVIAAFLSMAASAGLNAGRASAAWIASTAATSKSFTALKLLVGTPMVMPAIAIGAALAAIAAVVQAHRAAVSAIQGQQAASAAEANSSVAMMKSARARYDRGEISYDQMRKIVGIAARATGTNYAEGGMTLVGEHGPELVSLPRGSQVTQAYRTRQELSQGGTGGVTNILSGNFTFSTQESVNAFFNRLDKTQRLAKVGMA